MIHTSRQAGSRSSIKSLAGRPKRIGFILDSLDDDYQCTVLDGAIHAAEVRGVNLLALPGGDVGANPARNHLFELAGVHNLDGLIVLAGAVCNHIGLSALSAYCERYRSLPTCSIAGELTGMPSVQVDDQTGVREVISHLIRVHDCRHIAFVRGPETNGEAERRFQAYLETLQEHGLSHDPALIAPGDFEKTSGAAAVRLIIDERRVPLTMLDAIAAADDMMALGVLEELHHRGIRVPDEVAVVGFDDVEETHYSSPPLTTVRQPTGQQGAEAVRIVLNQVLGQEETDSICLPTQAVVRLSCGCLPSASPLGMSLTSSSRSRSFDAALIARRALIVAELARAARGKLSCAGHGWEERLLNAFAMQLQGDSDEAFTRAFDSVLTSVLANGGDVAVCHDIITALRTQVLTCIKDDPEQRTCAENILQHVRFVTGNALERAQAQRRMAARNAARQLNATTSQLVSSFELARLRETLEERLPALGISRCYLSVYPESLNGDGEAQPDRAQLLVFVDPSAAGKDVPVEVTYPARDLGLPAMLDGAPGTYVIEPLFHGEVALGLLVLEFGSAESWAYEVLREFVSAALNGAKLARVLADERSEHQKTLQAIREVRDSLKTGSTSQDALDKLDARLAEAAERFAARN